MKDGVTIAGVATQRESQQKKKQNLLRQFQPFCAFYDVYCSELHYEDSALYSFWNDASLQGRNTKQDSESLQAQLLCT